MAAMAEVNRLVDSLCDVTAPVVFFPVRHHSPAAARLLRQLIRERRPVAVLIEGPSDYNDQLDQLFLPHRLPIAIYTYQRRGDGLRRGAFYPFCEYSPEWVALQTAREQRIPARFIDLPFADLPLRAPLAVHRYNNGELRDRGAVELLCERFGVDDMDALWDLLFEEPANLSLADYMKRCHLVCLEIRRSDEGGRESEFLRERTMAEAILRARNEFPQGQILVVTGGFHSSALWEYVTNGLPAAPQADAEEVLQKGREEQRGLALTPYSFERLDALKGYESGMPAPGFYQLVWEARGGASRTAVSAEIFRPMLSDVAARVRKLGQVASSADLIAVETMARGLALLRGRAEVWRTDLVDGIIGALVKDEVILASSHPFLEALHEVLRGDAVGRLAEGSALPPLVHDIRHRLEEHDLLPEVRRKERRLNLHLPAERGASRILNQMHGLGISGVQLVDSADLLNRTDLREVWELWRMEWSPQFDADCIEAALYGADLPEAAAARLRDQARHLERDAKRGAELLIQSARMGLTQLAREFLQQLRRLLHEDSSFFNVSSALGHILYLYRFDEVLETRGSQELLELLALAQERALYLLESLGNTAGEEEKAIAGLRTVLDVYERAGGDVGLVRGDFLAILERVSSDTRLHPMLRGGAAGALWTLGEASSDHLLAQLRLFSKPENLGDFLAGLFALAREAAQREPALIASVDGMMMGYNDEQFLEALPAMRLAFSRFTPREKHHIVRSLLKGGEAADLPELVVSTEEAAEAMAWETRFFATLSEYGIRGGER